MSGLLRSLRVGVPSGGLRERREPQSWGGVTAGPGESQSGEESGEVQKVLPKEN